MDVWGLPVGTNQWRMWLGDLRRIAQQAAESWDPEQLLATPEADIVDYLVAQYAVERPVLRPELAAHLPLSGVTDGTVIVAIAVPFDGDGEILDRCFRRKNSRRLPDVQIKNSELHLAQAIRVRADADPAAIRAKVNRYFDSELRKAEKYLSQCDDDIARHNARLRTQVSSVIAQRKATLMTDRRLEASLGYPVPQRQDAPQFAVPVTRRKIQTLRRPAASTPSRPEWVLPETQYEEALAVLRNARNTLERHPSMTTHLLEERIRDLLLAFLNSQFEGKAAGEVFNAAGKTDILIRAEDRNVFIAECKIWKSPATIRDALEQLLSYLTWRDTKAALLIFIRHGEPPTEVINKAIKEIEEHPNYKRTFGTGEEGERYDFILHATGDPGREIRLAFLPFALQDKEIPRQQQPASAEDAKRSRRRANTPTKPHGSGAAGS